MIKWKLNKTYHPSEISVQAFLKLKIYSIRKEMVDFLEPIFFITLAEFLWMRSSRISFMAFLRSLRPQESRSKQLLRKHPSKWPSWQLTSAETFKRAVRLNCSSMLILNLAIVLLNIWASTSTIFCIEFHFFAVLYQKQKTQQKRDTLDHAIFF